MPLERDIPDTRTTPKPEIQTRPWKANVDITSEAIKASEASHPAQRNHSQQEKGSEPVVCSPGQEMPDVGKGAAALAHGASEAALVAAVMDELEQFFPEKSRATLLHGAQHLVKDCGVKSARTVRAFMTKQHIVPPSQRIENTPTWENMMSREHWHDFEYASFWHRRLPPGILSVRGTKPRGQLPPFDRPKRPTSRNKGTF